MITADKIKAAADALQRMEVLESVRERVLRFGSGRGSFPVSFPDQDGTYYPGREARLYYPREQYLKLIENLIAAEKFYLATVGVEVEERPQ